MKKIVGMFCMILCICLSGCAQESIAQVMRAGEGNETTRADAEGQDDEDMKPVSRNIFAMDTYMTVTAYGDKAKEAVKAAADEIERLDTLLSAGDEDSEIFRLNKQGGGIVSSDTRYLLERSLDIWEQTKGVFEIAVYPIMEAWGFTDGNFQVPSKDTLEQILLLADSGGIHLDEEAGVVTFDQEGMRIDLGGIAKGYTSGRIMDIFKEYEVVSGVVSLGGNVQVYGEKPDGTEWRVAIQDPEDTTAYLGTLKARDCAVITSGGYERYFEEGGVTYHHIIDPATGYPADNGLVSVTVVSPDGTLADGLSTSLFIMGTERAKDYWRDHSEEFDAVLMDDKGVVYVTEGIEDQFSSDRTVEVIGGA